MTDEQDSPAEPGLCTICNDPMVGGAQLDHTKPYLSVDQATIRRAFEVAL